MSNNLIYETSPYLLQHAENPVDWYAWGDEAFDKAKRENKPVFLSIGYSTCHWCHVMAHESFENKEVASILNKYYVSIKVDKEERPDIDNIYMRVCQAFTGSGGWPTSIFMTPEQKPFFAGTYFPAKAKNGMIGLYELLIYLHDKWESEKDALISQAENVCSFLLNNNEKVKTTESEKNQLLHEAAKEYKANYDVKNGGFGRAPKFPMPHSILFLLQYYQKYKDEKCLEMAQNTLIQMYRGGMFDHIGFGFCRYSTDSRFLVPHFEKMLYDNALMILAYCEAYICTKKQLFLEVAEKTASYILREMTSQDGGFYSAQDADSDGEEGKFYTLTPDEIINLLGEADGNEFNRHFDISRKGNFDSKNIPNLLFSDPEIKIFDKFLPQIEKYRKTRCKLHTDDKILTAWNSLMIVSFCKLYRICGKKIYLEAAQDADSFIMTYMADKSENGVFTLYASFSKNKRGAQGFLDDYAAYIWAKLSLYSITYNDKYISEASLLCRNVLQNFSADDGFYFSSGKKEKLIAHTKETYDGAIPSGNSIMTLNLIYLAHLTSDEIFYKAAEKQINFMMGDAIEYPTGHAMFLFAYMQADNQPLNVTVAVEPDAFDTFKDSFINIRQQLLQLPPDANVTVLPEPMPEFPLINGKTTFYVCKGRTCLPPCNELNL